LPTNVTPLHYYGLMAGIKLLQYQGHLLRSKSAIDVDAALPIEFLASYHSINLASKDEKIVCLYLVNESNGRQTIVFNQEWLH
jgi:hypothetical protein